FRCQGVKLFFVHNKIPVSECIISETGIYTNCGRGSSFVFTKEACRIDHRLRENLIQANKTPTEYATSH
ncbi:hypothetical protein Q7402_08530, partial [Glaesserella parasuis]|nr:hypothetical protein [Glaesserella parasuis]